MGVDGLIGFPSLASYVGFCSNSKAAVPATIGVAMEVTDMVT